MNKDFDDMNKFEQAFVIGAVNNRDIDSRVFESPLYIAIQINGIGVDVQGAINGLSKICTMQLEQIDELVQERAELLVKEKIFDIVNKLYEEIDRLSSYFTHKVDDS